MAGPMGEGAVVTPEKIYTFGCSYTYGAKIWDRRARELDNTLPTEPITLEDNASWPAQLSLLMPDTEILDYSFLGTSLEYSIYQFNRIKQQITDRDLTIVCATSPYRYTHWADESLNDVKRLRITGNYEKYSPDIRHKLIRYHPGWERNKAKQQLDLGVYWTRYSLHNKELEATMYSSLLEYLNTHADLVFTHHDYSFNTHNTLEIPCVQHMLSKEQFNSYVHDEGLHFNSGGAKWVAEWVHNQIKDRL